MICEHYFETHPAEPQDCTEQIYNNEANMYTPNDFESGDET